jgi:hypothetical protein
MRLLESAPRRYDFGIRLLSLGRVPDSPLAEGQFGRLPIQITAAHDREHAAGIFEWRRNEGL